MYLIEIVLFNKKVTWYNNIGGCAGYSIMVRFHVFVLQFLFLIEELTENYVFFSPIKFVNI